MGDAISFTAGVALLFFGLLAVRAFWPRNFSWRASSSILETAIFLSFIAAVANTLYWQVFGQIAVQAGLLTVFQLRSVGDWLDGLFKGSAALAAYLHLRALWLELDASERRRWTILEMAYYPKRRWCLSRIAAARALWSRMKGTDQ